MDDDDTLLEVALSLGSEALSAATVRFVEAVPQPIVKGRFAQKFLRVFYLLAFSVSQHVQYLIRKFYKMSLCTFMLIKMKFQL